MDLYLVGDEYNNNDVIRVSIYYQFNDSRSKEVKGLLEKGIFKVILTTNIPTSIRVFKSQFVDKVKNKGTNKELLKSRLIV